MRCGLVSLPPDHCTRPDEPVTVPPDLPPVRPSAQEGSLERIVEIVWRRFDRWLDNPIRIEHSPCRRRIWVFDVAYYEVDRNLRMVRGGVVDSTGQLFLHANLDLLAPLEDQRWFETLMGRIFENLRGGERFASVPPNIVGAERKKAISLTWSRLLGDSRFQAVAHAVRHEMGLDMSIWRLACEASVWWQGLTAEEYQLAWQNLPGYRQVRAENPGLLMLLPTFLTCHDDRFESEPIRVIKGWFRTHGLSEAGWRFLAREGMDHFVPLLRRLLPSAHLSGLLRFLKIVEAMEFDTNLFDVVTNAWVDVMATGAQSLSLQEDWYRLHPSVLRVAYGASRDIGAWAIEERAKELPAVLRWAKEEGVVLNKQQIRAGWSPLARRWRQDRPEEAEGIASFRFEWTPMTGRLEFGELVAVPLCSAAVLREEGEAMENCLGSQYLTAACLGRRMAVYSIRRIDSGSRLAVASFVRQRGKSWTLQEVKGPRNSIAPDDAIKASEDVLGRICDSSHPARSQ